MKEDKEKHQPVSESIASGEPKTSSSMLTLRQLNKETEKKEAAAEAVKVRCRICFKETAPTPRCFGHGGGGGGGDGGGSGNTSEDKAAPGASGTQSSTQSEKITGKEEWLSGSESNSMSDTELESTLDGKIFDPEIIAELIAEGLLLVDNDRESMTLSIKLQCEPNSLTEEQRDELNKFLKAILEEFDEFKKENALSDDCIKITHDEKGNILSIRIAMPTLALYDAFIQQLANNLIPSPSPKIQEDKATKDHNLAPNPFSMEPKPSSSHEQVEEDEKEQEIFNPSPFKMKPW